MKILIPILCIVTLSLVLLVSGGSAAEPPNIRHANQPCKELVVHIHNIIYTGDNFGNATSAVIGEPGWANKTGLTSTQNSFGDLIVVDDHVTADANLHSPPIGQAYGFYLYTRKDAPAAWHGFSIFFNSTEHKGKINFAGLNLMMENVRDISVIGGTGDFFMARGIATFSPDAVEVGKYYAVRLHIKLYECWKLDSS